MRIPLLTLFFVLALAMLTSVVHADFGYDNPTKPKLNTPDSGGQFFINNSFTNQTFINGTAENWSRFPALQNVDMLNWGLMSLGASNITGDMNFLAGSTLRFYNGLGTFQGGMAAAGTAARFIGANGGNFGIDVDNGSLIYINDLRTTADFYVDWLLGTSIHVDGDTGFITLGRNVTAPNICYSNGTNCVTTNLTPVYAAIANNVSNLNTAINSNVSNLNTAINSNVSNLNTAIVNNATATRQQQINYDWSFCDAAGPPNGFYLIDGQATTSLSRGWMAMSNIEVTSVTLTNGNRVECIGVDATTNNSCRVGVYFNVSGTIFNEFNITLYQEQYKTVNYSINLSYGDYVVMQGYGAVAGNVSTVGLTSVCIPFGWRYR